MDTTTERISFVGEIDERLKGEPFPPPAGAIAKAITDAALTDADATAQNYLVWKDLLRHYDEQRPNISWTGLAFIIGGIVTFLIAVANDQMESTFTFILVVVALAIFFYGTGTISNLTASSPDAQASYRVRLAGGAGVLALVAGAVLVYAQNQIKTAFLPQEQVAKLELHLQDNGRSNFQFSDYHIALTDLSSGDAIPASRFDGSKIHANLIYTVGNRPCPLVIETALTPKSGGTALLYLHAADLTASRASSGDQDCALDEAKIEQLERKYDRIGKSVEAKHDNSRGFGFDRYKIKLPMTINQPPAPKQERVSDAAGSVDLSEDEIIINAY